MHNLKEGPRNGYVFIYDLKGATARHFMQAKLSSIQKAISIVNYAAPFKLRAVHVLNTPKFVNIVLGKFL